MSDEINLSKLSSRKKPHEKIDTKIQPKYFENIIDSIEWPEELKSADYYKKLTVALLTQQNLQMSRMFDMLAIACGLSEESEDISSEAPDISVDDQIKAGLKKSVICGSCGNGVVPDKMGYCPKCHNDLKKQIGLEIINDS